jgi:hypothetical protein
VVGSSNFRFSNCTFIVWNGVPISCYRKTTYKEEGNDFLENGYGYDFGDWKSYPTPELQNASDAHKEIAKLFNSGKNQIVAARTCYDMNRTPKLSKQIKLLILTADDPPGLESWKTKVSSAVTCVCDACNSEFLVISGIRYPATRINVSPFIYEELSCILTVYYGDVFDEIADVDYCCRFCST